jgi:hypothetical protein
VQTPSFIQDAGILELPSEFPWKGEGMHYGPEQGTKLHDALQDLTVCGQTVVAARTLEWLLWRLHNAVDTRIFFDYLEAVFAWTVDYRYKDENPLGDLLPPSTSASNQALRDAVWTLRRVADDRYYRSPNTRDDKVTAIASITKQTLPAKPKKAFTGWLSWAVQRTLDLSPRPRGLYPVRKNFASDEEYYEAGRPFVGVALPREALDPKAGYKPGHRQELLSRFIEGLDWKNNPFLRAPDEMKKLDFPGAPYKF